MRYPPGVSGDTIMRNDIALLWLRGFITAAYECGNRRSELATIRVGQFDRVPRIIRLKRLDTKSGKPRELGLSDELYALLTACAETRQPMTTSLADGHAGACAQCATSASYGARC